MKLPWKNWKSRRGSGLLTVLTASALLLMMALTVTGTSFHHLSLTNRLNHAQNAQNLAESALARVVAQLMVQHTRYQSGDNPADSFVAISPDQKIYLAFTQDQVDDANSKLRSCRLERSYNNFGQDNPYSLPGGRSVPADGAYLRAVAVDHGVERAAECVIYIPKFPWSLASAGPIKIDGQTKIASYKNLSDVGNPEKELPGHLVSNSIDATKAIEFLGDQVVVTGDVQASGGATLGDNVVRGERRFGANPAALPKIRIEDYDTEGTPGVKTITDSDQEVTGFAHRTGSLTLSNGLKLNGGVVYVKGDVTISGQIQGEGAIIATGRLEITGNGQLASNNKVALLSRGDMVLTGQSEASRRLLLNGMIYTEGSLTTQNTDITGNAISTADNGSGMNLQDSSLSSVTTVSSVEVNVGGGNPAPLTISTSSPTDIPGGVIQARFDVPREALQNGNTYEFRYETSSAFGVNGNPLPAGTYVGRLGTAPDGSTRLYDEPAPGPATAALPANSVVLTMNGQELRKGDTGQVREDFITAYMDSNGISTREAAAAEIDNLYLNPNSGFYKANLFRQLSYDLNVHQYTSPEDPVSTQTWKLDLGGKTSSGQEFISRAERIRLLFWREVP